MRTKELINEQERKSQYALELAIEAGVLKRCPYHEGSIYLGNKEIKSAYKLANSKWQAGEINTDFKTCIEMTDSIKEAVHEHGLYSCNLCNDIANK